MKAWELIIVVAAILTAMTILIFGLMGCQVTPKAVDVGKLDQLSATVKGIEAKVDAKINTKVEAKGLEIQSKGAVAILVYGLVKDTIFGLLTGWCVWWLFPRKGKKVVKCK